MCDKSKSSSSWFFLHRDMIWLFLLWFKSSSRCYEEEDAQSNIPVTFWSANILIYHVIYCTRTSWRRENGMWENRDGTKSLDIAQNFHLWHVLRLFIFLLRQIIFVVVSILDIHWNILDISSGWQGLDLDMHFTPNTDVLWRCNEIQLPNW